MFGAAEFSTGILREWGVRNEESGTSRWGKSLQLTLWNSSSQAGCWLFRDSLCLCGTEITSGQRLLVAAGFSLLVPVAGLCLLIS